MTSCVPKANVYETAILGRQSRVGSMRIQRVFGRGFDTALNCHRRNSEFLRDVSNTFSVRMQPSGLVATENFVGTAAVDALRFSVSDAAPDTLQRYVPFELGQAPQNIQQKAPAGVALVRIDSLRHADEPHAVGVEGLHVLDQLRERSAKAVQFPDHNRVEMPEAGVCHESVQGRPIRFNSGNTFIRVLLMNIPLLACAVVAQLAKLHAAVLVGCGYAGVKSNFHIIMIHVCGTDYKRFL